MIPYEEIFEGARFAQVEISPVKTEQNPRDFSEFKES